MDDLTLPEFLLARIAEDEAAAAAAHRESMRGHAGPGFIRSRIAWTAQAKDVRGHELIEQFTPARVLAQCEANRQIVEIHQRRPRGPWFECAVCFDPNTQAGDYDFEAHPCPTLRLLALPYADHPDYREEWRP